MNRIAVLLNNKLITCDTILPVMAELKKRKPDLLIEFVCFHAKTGMVIRQNIVLWELIQSIATFTVLGRARNGILPSLVGRLSTIAWLVRSAWLGATGQISFIHFKALNRWPLRLIAHLSKGRVCYFENTAAGFAEIERRVSEAMVVRRHPKSTPAADLLVSFTKDWLPLKDPRLSGVPRTMIPPSFTYAAWIDFIRSHAKRYLADLLGQLGPDTPVITFILSSMEENGLLREPHLFPALFEETLDSLEEAGCSDPILIKPHPTMNAKYKAFIEDAARRRPHLRIIFCDVHPFVLALRSRFVIGNCYSTTFSIFSYLGIPRIEYTDYRPDLLAITNQQSMRPDHVSHFINADRGRLVGTMRELLARTPQANIEGIRPDFPPALMTCLGLS